MSQIPGHPTYMGGLGDLMPRNRVEVWENTSVPLRN